MRIPELDDALDSLIAGHPEQVSICDLLELMVEAQDAGMTMEALIAGALADEAIERMACLPCH